MAGESVRSRRGRAAPIQGPELPGRPLNVRSRWRWWRLLSWTPRSLSWVAAVLSASLIAMPFYSYLAGPPPIEWGLLIVLVPMGALSVVALIVGVVLWGAGQGDVWASALARGLVGSPALAFGFVVIVGLIVQH